MALLRQSVGERPRRYLSLSLWLFLFLCSSLAAQEYPDLNCVGEGRLLYKSPISGKYEAVALQHTNVAIDVQGLASSATVTQQYANTSSTPIEAIYIFPLPHDAAVYDLEVRVGDRLIRSVIRERQEAKRVYEQAKTEGKRAALLEQERPNIFTASVANIMPGDRIDVRLRYVQPLKWHEGTVRLVFPMVVGPRYIPGTQPTGHQGTGWSSDTDAVPDASRITPTVHDPGSRPGHDISLVVELDSGLKGASVESVSHGIKVTESRKGKQRVELTTGTTNPNRDFVLEIRQANTSRPETLLALSSTKKQGDSHFMLTAYPPVLPPQQRAPVEMLYMIDVSGSMAGTSIEQARTALLQALGRLRSTDRFGLLAFSSGFREFSPDVLPATDENIARARRYVQELRAEGGTEMLPALEHLMRKPQTEGYLRHIVLLTDGDLGNEEQIFAALHRDLGDARLFTVAIGSAPNQFLATKMAQYGRGAFTQISDVSETQKQMTVLLENIEAPVLTDVQLTFDGIEIADLYPKRIPDLFAREPLIIFGRVTNGARGKIHLKAMAATVPYEATFDIDPSKAQFHPAIPTLWARQRVEELMDDYRHSNEPEQLKIRQQVIEHAIQYRLVTRFTSLVAVEEVAVNPGGNSNAVAVPTELPAGWQMDKVFGAPQTGTADNFLLAVAVGLLLAGGALFLVSRHQRSVL